MHSCHRGRLSAQCGAHCLEGPAALDLLVECCGYAQNCPGQVCSNEQAPVLGRCHIPHHGAEMLLPLSYDGPARRVCGCHDRLGQPASVIWALSGPAAG